MGKSNLNDLNTQDRLLFEKLAVDTAYILSGMHTLGGEIMTYQFSIS